jgi:hypothetical protein
MLEQIWDIFRCCVCEKYFDKETRKVVKKPEGIVMSHGYCDDCAKAFMTEIMAMGGGRK